MSAQQYGRPRRWPNPVGVALLVCMADMVAADQSVDEQAPHQPAVVSSDHHWSDDADDVTLFIDSVFDRLAAGPAAAVVAASAVVVGICLWRQRRR